VPACWTRPHPSAGALVLGHHRTEVRIDHHPVPARPGPPRRHCRRIECGRGLHVFWRAQRENRVGLTAGSSPSTPGLVFCRTSAELTGSPPAASRRRRCGRHPRRPPQSQRERALSASRPAKASVLVATDSPPVAIHRRRPALRRAFDPPNDRRTTSNRSGRTGRAGNTGTVVSLVTDESTGHRA